MVCPYLPGRVPLVGGPVEISHQAPPAAKAKEQEVPQIAQKKIRGENFGTKLRNKIFPTTLSPHEIPPPPPAPM